MRWITMLILGGVLALSGCGDDSSGTGGSAGTGGGGGAGGIGDNEAPVITMVAWAPVGACPPSGGGSSDYTVTVTAMDDNTAPMDLTYEGSVGGCDGQIDAPVSTINCPNAALYNGMVVVRDESLASVPVNFAIDVCETGSTP